jgi:hypothetical protein
MYTPRMSDASVISLRRLAWAMGTSMPAAVNRVISLLPSVFDSGMVCLRCRDNSKCSGCVFSRVVTQTDAQTISAL